MKLSKLAIFLLAMCVTIFCFSGCGILDRESNLDAESYSEPSENTQNEENSTTTGEEKKHDDKTMKINLENYEGEWVICEEKDKGALGTVDVTTNGSEMYLKVLEMEDFDIRPLKTVVFDSPNKGRSKETFSFNGYELYGDFEIIKNDDGTEQICILFRNVADDEVVLQPLNMYRPADFYDRNENVIAYKNILEEVAYGSSEARYGLFDIDGDAVYELICDAELWKYDVYSFKNNTLVYAGEIDSKYGLHCYKDMLLSSNGGTGYTEYSEVTLNDEYEIQQANVPYLSREYFIENKFWDYRLKGTEISSEEFEKIYNDIEELKMLPANNDSLLEIL